MRRIILWLVSIFVIAAIAVVALRQSAPQNTSGDAEVNTEGHFVSDSLGVTLMLPPAKGWRFERSGGPYLSALHESDRATVQLFVRGSQSGTLLNDVIAARQQVLAQSFNADSLSQVIGRTVQEEFTEVNGHPVYQWQAITHPLSMEAGKQSRVMFMWTATVRPDNIYECLAMLLIPMDLLPEEQREYDALVQDVAFIMQSFRVR